MRWLAEPGTAVVVTGRQPERLNEVVSTAGSAVTPPPAPTSAAAIH